ncbi:MAG: YlbL family protein [Mycobacteriaceae bacterium]
MNRRILTVVAALVPTTVLGVFGALVTVPFVALGPGPTFNTLGVVAGDDGQEKNIVDITGTEVDKTSGNLNMTTVAVRDHLKLYEALGYWFSGRQQLVPRDEIYPADQPKEKIEEQNKEDFTQSEDSAELAALRYLGFPFEVQVASVSEQGPSVGALAEKDRITAIDGVQVASNAALQDFMATTVVGQEVLVDFVRAGQPGVATVVLGKHPTKDRGVLGITTSENPQVPFTVNFNLGDVGGPSAGLMFTLAVIDKLSPGELNGGKFVAGTGTIDPDGAVGPIGGINHKLVAAREAGATIFLVPDKNCAEAVRNAPSGLTLVRVQNLAGAVSALTDLHAGKEVVGCS